MTTPVANTIVVEFYRLVMGAGVRQPSLCGDLVHGKRIPGGRQRIGKFCRVCQVLEADRCDGSRNRSPCRPIQHHGCQGIIGTKYQSKCWKIADFHYPQPNLVEAWRKRKSRHAPLFRGMELYGRRGDQDTE